MYLQVNLLEEQLVWAPMGPPSDAVTAASAPRYGTALHLHVHYDQVELHLVPWQVQQMCGHLCVRQKG